MSNESAQLFTIGHSTHSLETFISLLRRHRLTAVADVRSTPFSRINPHFVMAALKHALKAHGIDYVFLGNELGGRPDLPSCYENGRVHYPRLAATELFQRGLVRLMHGLLNHRLVIMCAESEPLECHRALLIARALDERGMRVQHILADGRLESHSDAMERLLDVTGVPREDLFRSRQELIAEALARQEQRVAYMNPVLAEDPTRSL